MCATDACSQPSVARGLCKRHHRMHSIAGTLEGFPRQRASSGDGIRFLEGLLEKRDEHCVWFLGRQSRYPTLKIDGQTVAAHRLALVMVTDGDMPRLEAAHTCGNGHLGCVNPGHLYWATHAENMADVARLGRTTNPPRYTPHQAQSVVELGLSGRCSHPEIAAAVGVSPKQVQSILAARGIHTNQRRPANKITNSALIESVRALAETMTQQAIADRVGVSQAFVSRQIRAMRTGGEAP